VIVTGARGGLGRATVELLEQLGCSVAGCDAEDFDVRDRAAVDAGVMSCVERLGGCDAVVANAGIVDTIHRAERFSEAEWERDVETNLTGSVQRRPRRVRAAGGIGRRSHRGHLFGHFRNGTPGPGRVHRR
jgi:NADP-dependent 3-hydroxy acid dehydrogenase YdfG